MPEKIGSRGVALFPAAWISILFLLAVTGFPYGDYDTMAFHLPTIYDIAQAGKISFVPSPVDKLGIFRAYPQFFEYLFVQPVALTHTIYGTWMIQVWVIIGIYYTISYMLSSCGVDRSTRSLIAMFILCCNFYWFIDAGPSSLKNDLTLGFIGLSICALGMEFGRHSAKRWSLSILSGVLVLVALSIKYSAIQMIAIVMLMVHAGLLIRWIRNRRRHDDYKRWYVIFVSVMVLFGIAGLTITYWRNYFVFGNPCYPFTIGFRNLIFKGPMSYSGESFWLNRENPTVWVMWFNSLNTRIGAEAILGLMFLFPTLIICIVQMLRRRNAGGWILLYSLGALVLILLHLAAPLSAGKNLYLKYGGSLRHNFVGWTLLLIATNLLLYRVMGKNGVVSFNCMSLVLKIFLGSQYLLLFLKYTRDFGVENNVLVFEIASVFMLALFFLIAAMVRKNRKNLILRLLVVSCICLGVMVAPVQHQLTYPVFNYLGSMSHDDVVAYCGKFSGLAYGQWINHRVVELGSPDELLSLKHNGAKPNVLVVEDGRDTKELDKNADWRLIGKSKNYNIYKEQSEKPSR